MGAAAGAAVGPGELRDPHRPLQGLFAAVGDGGQLLRGGIIGPEGVIFPDVAVGPGLHLQHLLPGHGGVIVDGDHVRSHVEAHVVAGKGSAQHTADDVLAGVLLHMVKAAGPVDGAVDGGPHGQGPVAGVEHQAVPLLDVQHRRAAQVAVVRRLAAALRVKGRAVQGHKICVPLAGPAVGDDGVELLQKCVPVIQLLGVHGASSSDGFLLSCHIPPGFARFVDLSNILDSELISREPAEGSHG